MGTTLVLSDELVGKARAISGIDRITDLVREGLNALNAREAPKRLIAFGGTDSQATAAPRDRGPSIAAEPQP